MTSDAGAPPQRPGWRFTLYVAGRSPRSLAAIENLSALCETLLPGRYEIEVIDAVGDPSRAAADDVVVLPTLVRRMPAPHCKVIGDLSDTHRLLIDLGLHTG